LQKLTPMMQQYLSTKERYPEAILFFRLGDFYEMFFDDAVLASRTLDLTLTSRDKDAEDPVPMCGVPYHAASGYIARLLERGYQVAICDQVEDPRQAKGIVKREVTRVVTPGTVLEEEVLDARAPSYLLAVAPGETRFGLAFLDLSTGEFRMLETEGRDALFDETARIEPREVLVPRGADPAWLEPYRERFPRTLIHPVAAEGFELSEAEKRLERRFGGVTALREGYAEGIRAAGAVLAYLENTASQDITGAAHIARLVPVASRTTMVIDEATQVNLELCETLRGERQGSLLHVLDRTQTAMGARRLRSWLRYPLLLVDEIRQRHAAVEALLEESTVRADLCAELGLVHDLERLTGRVATGMATPRDLWALRRSLEHIPAVRALLSRLDAPLLTSLRGGMEEFADIAAEIARTLIDDPPATTKEGGYIRAGCNAELDELLGITQDGKGWLLRLEQEQRRATGIGSLKVRYNKVFGYYLEVTQANLDKVPAHYIRKQTLAGVERFVTPELKEMEARVLGAEERRLAVEREIFEDLRKRISASASRLQATASRLADLDALASLAEVAERQRYVRPAVDEGDRIEIVEGRHPVVEAMGLPEGFVPNDVFLDGAENQLLLITGPNMAGKSTVLRQTAVISLLAQMGSFVPASRATLGIVDRIFTRVGARDDLARGRSTFMVEMSETAQILHHATRKSLIVLDEIGRGTSTYDGVSIAWAVAEYLHDRVGAKTLFATHYHELTELADSKERVRNFHIAVREWKDQVIFLRKLVAGGANRSYGIQVGRLAGLPREVLDRAREVLASLERHALDSSGRPALSVRAGAHSAGQLSLFRPAAAEVSPLEEALRALELDQLTPLQALETLYRLRELAAKP
jgi:DNA mismatch repair protein MutS